MKTIAEALSKSVIAPDSKILFYSNEDYFNQIINSLIWLDCQFKTENRGNKNIRRITLKNGSVLLFIPVIKDEFFLRDVVSGMYFNIVIFDEGISCNSKFILKCREKL